MAVPTVAAVATTNINTGTSHAVNLPTHSAGTLLIMIHCVAPARTITVPTDWAAIYNHSTTGGVFASMLAWRYATADHGSTATVSLDGSAAILTTTLAISGAEDPATTALVALSGGAADGTAQAASITATDNDSLLLISALKAGGDAWTGTLTGHTAQANISNTTSFDDLVVFSRDTGASAGVIGAVDIEDTAGQRWRTYHIAAAPTSGGTSAIPAFIHHRRLLGVQ